MGNMDSSADSLLADALAGSVEEVSTDGILLPVLAFCNA